MLKMLIVDDHIIVREGLRQLMVASSKNSIEAEVCSGLDALRSIRGSSYGLVMIGTFLSGVDQIELLRQIRAQQPNLPILALGGSDDEQYGARLMRAGASGFITRGGDPDDLLEAVASVCRGHRYVSPQVADLLATANEGVVPSKESLSDREYQVMVSIASGKRVKQIAEEMSLSVKTVSTYHTRLLQKLGLDNDVQLIRYAIEQGVISDGVSTRQKLILTDLSFKTASAVATVRELWRVRKDVIILLVITSVLAFIILNYIVRNFVF